MSYQIQGEDSLAHALRRQRHRQTLAAEGGRSGLVAAGTWEPFNGDVGLPADFPPEVLEAEARYAPRSERAELLRKAAALREMQGKPAPRNRHRYRT